MIRPCFSGYIYCSRVLWGMFIAHCLTVFLKKMVDRHLIIGQYTAFCLMLLLAACGSNTVEQQLGVAEDCNSTTNNSFGPPPGTPFGPPATGLSFSAPNPISQNFGKDASIATAALDGKVYVYVAWVGIGQRGQLQIFFARSVDGGVTFESVFPLPGTESLSPIQPSLAASGQHVYLVWAVQSSSGPTIGNSQIKFAYSDKLGAKDSFFIHTEPLSDPSRHSVFPSIASAGNTVYVSWVELETNQEADQNQTGDQWLARSLNDGGNFDPAVNISATGSAVQTPAALAVDENRLYVAWEDLGNCNTDSETIQDICLVWSDDGGKTLSAAKNLSENLSSSGNPAIAVTQDHIYVMWDDFSDINIPVLRLRRSSDRGESFGPSFDFQTIGPQPPHIAAEGDNVFIAWEDRDAQTCNLQVFVSTSKDAGGSFSIPRNISQNPTSAKNPAIAAAEGLGYLVWQGQSGSGDAARDIIFFDRLVPDGP